MMPKDRPALPGSGKEWPEFIRTSSQFILENTQLLAPALTPEIKLHLATEFTPMWRMVEAQLAVKDAPAPFWCFAWPGGQALARYVMDHPESVAGKTVFDFASGSGICAFAARRAGATRVIANDVDPMAAVAIGLNAAACGLAVEVLHEDKVNRPLEGIDVILAGDFCYEWPMAGYAVEWLRGLVRLGKTVLFADPGRNYLPREGLRKLAEYRVETSKDVEDATVKLTSIYMLLEDEEG